MSLMGERAGAQAGVRVGGRVCGRAGRWAGGVGDVLLVRVGGVALLQGSIWRLEFIASRPCRSPLGAFAGGVFPRHRLPAAPLSPAPAPDPPPHSYPQTRGLWYNI